MINVIFSFITLIKMYQDFYLGPKTLSIMQNEGTLHSKGKIICQKLFLTKEKVTGE